MTLRRYAVSVAGFDPWIYLAPTAGKAKYMAFRAWRDAGYAPRPQHKPFRVFLDRLEFVHHLGRM